MPRSFLFRLIGVVAVMVGLLLAGCPDPKMPSGPPPEYEDPPPPSWYEAGKEAAAPADAGTSPALVN